ncbi:MAG: hypothetical protein ACM3ST_16325 [Bdellovibrio bacteriovorus]
MVATAGLSLDQAPPIHLPLRLFLTAPWFAVAAALILAFQGEAAMASRWTPAALAVTHLLAIGFLGQIMCGALLQMLPVIVGAPLPAVRLVAPLTHLLLSLGSALMSVGFLGLGAPLLGAGAAAAAGGFGVFVVASVVALARARGPAGTLLALRLAVGALAVTVSLGLLLTSALLGWVSLPEFPIWVQAHHTWGLLGWVGLLIVGVAYRVVPLFYVTSPYPEWMTRVLAPTLLALLAAATLLALVGHGGLARWLYGALALGFATFAAQTIRLQGARVRSRRDAALIHWWLALGSILAGACGWWLQAPAELMGVLVLVGVGVGLPSGMLLKIVPFLCWFHLQTRQVASGRFGVRVPHVHALIPDALARWHPLLHGLTLVVLAAAVGEPVLWRLGGVLLAASAIWLFALMAAATWRYGRVSAALD